MRRYWVYIILCSDGSLYTGYTSDVKRRLVQHNSGRASRYTRARLPVTLAYLERASSQGSALRRELKIKKLSRSSKLLLCSERLPKRPS
ncbi:MAG: GIY-YIG nuclease family protein [Thaumarchaeota archaeon]|nr:GIY-YIG nuclease family protein [Nitrososphaerota archaeon]